MSVFISAANQYSVHDGCSFYIIYIRWKGDLKVYKTSEKFFLKDNKGSICKYSIHNISTFFVFKVWFVTYLSTLIQHCIFFSRRTKSLSQRLLI